MLIEFSNLPGFGRIYLVFKDSSRIWRLALMRKENDYCKIIYDHPRY